MADSLKLVIAEREEQLHKHKYSFAHDREVNKEENLRFAAIATLTGERGDFPKDWDETAIDKILAKPYRERLVTAAALLLAELDRTDPLDVQDAE